MDANSSNDRLAEAQELIWSLLDDQIEDADFQRLETMLCEDEAIRELYVQCVQIHVDLHVLFDGKTQASIAPMFGAPLDMPVITGDGTTSAPTF